MFFYLLILHLELCFVCLQYGTDIALAKNAKTWQLKYNHFHITCAYI